MLHVLFRLSGFATKTEQQRNRATSKLLGLRPNLALFVAVWR